MNDAYVPTISDIIDQITVRREYLESNDGNPDEVKALIAASEALLNHVLREDRLARLIRLASPDDAA